MINTGLNLTLFQNSIGEIKKNSIILYDTITKENSEPKEILLDDFVFIELRERINYFYNRFTGLATFVTFFFGLILNLSLPLCLLGFALLFFSVYKKFRSYYLHITYKVPNILIVNIPSKKRDEAQDFIDKIYQYKNIKKGASHESV